MTDTFGSSQDAQPRESEVEEISDSGAGGHAGDRSDAGFVDVEIIDGASGDDDATVVVSGEDAELSDVTEARAQRDEYLDSLRRLQAEFENYKKRVAKQQSDQTARAALSLVEKLLPVLDTLDLAISHLGDAESGDGRALLAASGQLRDVLGKEGLERIDPLGEEFDPNAHEAVGQLPPEESDTATGVAPDGAGDSGPDPSADGTPADGDGAGASGEPVVGQVMRPGYRWRGSVVRPAMVMVRG